MLLDFQDDEKLLELKWKLLAKGDKKLLDPINKILGERWTKVWRKKNSLKELLGG